MPLFGQYNLDTGFQPISDLIHNVTFNSGCAWTAQGQKHFRYDSSTVLKPKLLILDTHGRFVRGCKLGSFVGRAVKLLCLAIGVPRVVGRLSVLTEMLLHLMQMLPKIALLLRCRRAFLGTNAFACLLVTLARVLLDTWMAFCRAYL